MANTSASPSGALTEADPATAASAELLPTNATSLDPAAAQDAAQQVQALAADVAAADVQPAADCVTPCQPFQGSAGTTQVCLTATPQPRACTTSNDTSAGPEAGPIGPSAVSAQQAPQPAEDCTTMCGLEGDGWICYTADDAPRSCLPTGASSGGGGGNSSTVGGGDAGLSPGASTVGATRYTVTGEECIKACASLRVGEPDICQVTPLLALLWLRLC